MLAGQADFLAYLRRGHRRIGPEQQEYLLLLDGGMDGRGPIHPGRDGFRGLPHLQPTRLQAFAHSYGKRRIEAGEAQEKRRLQGQASK